MNVLVFGGNGQLGRELVALAGKKSLNVSVADLPDFNICDYKSVESAVNKFVPDVIINCAAYTAVDKAESEEKIAYQVNSDGARNIALASEKFNFRFVHVSTDYVFGDGFSTPIEEGAETKPLNVYGASKLAGEQAILEIAPRSSIIARTASLHGQYGPNFVHTMLKLFKERETVSVVSDQIMSPTWAGWLATALFELAKQDSTGVVHTTSGEAVSWFDFAKGIIEETNVELSTKLIPILAKDFPRDAKRATYSVLNVDRLRSLTSSDFVIGWREGLKSHLKELGLN